MYTDGGEVYTDGGRGILMGGGVASPTWVDQSRLVTVRWRDQRSSKNSRFILRRSPARASLKQRSHGHQHHNTLCVSLYHICGRACAIGSINITILFVFLGARCSYVVRAFTHGAMGRRIDPSWSGPIELFLVPASAPRLV